MQGLDLAHILDVDPVVLLAPVHERAGGYVVGFAGVGVADLCGKEFHELDGGLFASGCDEGGE